MKLFVDKNTFPSKVVKEMVRSLIHRYKDVFSKLE